MVKSEDPTIAKGQAWPPAPGRTLGYIPNAQAIRDAAEDCPSYGISNQ